jgi:D-aspartate ligase
MNSCQNKNIEMHRVDTKELPYAVVMGLSPTGLHVIRELGREGVPVIGVASESQPAAFSCYLSGRIIEPDAERRITRLCEMFPMKDEVQPGCKPVLIPTSDQDVELIIQNHLRLSRHFSFQAVYSNGLASEIMDKESFYRLCEFYGVSYPKLWKGTAEEIRSLRDDLVYPCIVKPSLIHEIKSLMKGKKVWLIKDQADLDAIIDSIPDKNAVLLAQEIVPGPESEIGLYCAYSEGDKGVSQSFTARKLRQYPPGFGSASLVQSSDEFECKRITEGFLSSIGYHGIAASELKRDPKTGQWKMIEINVRPSLWFSISSSSGKRPVFQAYCSLANLEIELPENDQAQGVRWRYLLKDFWSAVFYKVNKKYVLPEPLTNSVGPKSASVLAVFSFDDPKPALAEMLLFMAKALRRISGK